MTETADQPKGVFQLYEPIDLYDKLERELLKIHANPLDTDAAFNFSSRLGTSWTGSSQGTTTRRGEISFAPALRS